MSEEQRTRGTQEVSARSGAGRRLPRARKTVEGDPLGADGKAGILPTTLNPAIVVFSADRQLVAMAVEAAGRDWIVRQSDDAAQAREVMSRLKVRLVVMDDEKIDPEIRGWLLEQIRKHAGSALVIYIAAEHDLDGERRARAHPVQFYTARPLDAERVRRVLESFVRASS
jgi:DNA-binding NtrC family response regulator